MSLSKTVRKFIEKEELFSSDDKLLCGVSGGMDSMAMLHLLYSEGYDLVVGHVNYRLRGSDSDQDAQVVKDYCIEYDITFEQYILTDIEVSDLQESNLQEKARTIRYRWFEELLERYQCKYLCMAHHQEDVVETYFLHAIRASGLQGMQSIQPKSAWTRRPLLSSSKEQIRKYVDEHHIPYREDVSNSDIKYDRNFIRNDVMSILKERWPHLTKSIYDSASHLSEENKLLSDLVTHQLKPYISYDGDVLIIAPISQLYDITDHLGSLLFHYLRESGFNKAQVDDMLRRTNTSGRYWLSATHQISIKEDQLLQKPRENENVSVQIDGPGEYIFPKGKLELSTSAQLTSSNSALIEYMDLSKVKWPLTCRQWHEGDKMMPIGMDGHSKLLSDILIDKKVNVLLKIDQLVIVDADDHIIWLVHQRLSDRVRYDGKTESYLKLEWIPT